jgi:hypothetical protein
MKKSLDAIIITAAPGIGKTTIFPTLVAKLSEKCALLDGDDVSRLIPFRLTHEWLDLVQDNISACAENFAKCGIRYFITCFCLPTQERIDRLTGLLNDLGYRVHCIALIADDDILLDRNRQRGGCDVRDADEFAETLRCNKGIKELKNVTFIDTSDISVEHIGQKVAHAILSLTR